MSRLKSLLKKTVTRDAISEKVHQPTENNLAARMKVIIEQHFPIENRYRELARLTSVGSDSWRQFQNGKQRPTMQMIEEFCQIFPEYTLWIVTGIEDKNLVQRCIGN
ncbi:hypothetical protein ACO0LB_17955 [Undibacterium sp. SXout7W]|uniref:hypothetical protein n=1 Tax=Undibacterium sp. SXout7W TaxID=3413049 RepID=UPI003BEF4F2E